MQDGILTQPFLIVREWSKQNKQTKMTLKIIELF